MADPTKPGERAGWEHIWTSGDIPPRYRSLAEPNTSVVQWADSVTPGGTILDIGCGVGRHVLYLGKRGFRMAGVDVSPSAIKMTQYLCAERQIAFEGRVSDMSAIPWTEGTFDGVLSTSTIHHQLRAGIEQTLGEIWRTLKPGGLLMVDFPYMDSFYEWQRRQVTDGEMVEVEPNTFVDPRPDPPDDEDGFLPHHFSDEADARDLLHDFETVRLWADLHEVKTPLVSGVRGKWVAWARK